ncbi:RNA polymerase sigma factor [Mucilaginibacter hurinus]|uniref:RNA polymerase sigma factor n=1 Tax=Mucilaginibacter hurinus TaxID=2201324 RepID=UPI00131478DA|nr:RNA polymerase sigma-70 factor [Mucilaginibacter hurinus]
MNNQVSDSDLINQLVSGDEASFTVIYNRYSAKVYRLAFRFLKDEDQSEEIVQEVFINLWLSRDKLTPDGNLWLYLYVIAKRLSLNALRQVYRSSDLSEKLLKHISIEDNHTEEDVLAHDLEVFTEKIIQQLPKQQQLVYKLSRVDGLSHKEIAEQLHISQNTVKNHMVSALKTLKDQLKQSEFVFLIALLFCK